MKLLLVFGSVIAGLALFVFGAISAMNFFVTKNPVDGNNALVFIPIGIILVILAFKVP